MIHKITPNDTLDRICLMFDKSKDVIRKANGFTGDEIYMKKELIIPMTSKLILFINLFLRRASDVPKSN